MAQCIPVQSTSVWMRHGLIETHPLRESISADVCIIGGGIAGLLVATNLLKEGKSVVILSDSPIAGGETCRTTAHLSTALDTRYMELATTHGPGGAWIAAHSHAAAITHLEDLASLLNIPCDFMRLDGYLTVNERHALKMRDLLARELEASKSAGVLGLEVVPNLPRGWPQDCGPALRFPRLAQFDPALFIEGLFRHLQANGVRIFTGTHATEVMGGPDAFVKTREEFAVHCEQIVVATNTPINDRVTVHTKLAGYQTYVVAANVDEEVMDPALFWDGVWEDDDWYHYVRLVKGDGGPDLLLVGGEDHKTGQSHEDSSQFDRLEHWMRTHFPRVGTVEYRWSGQIMESVDGLGYIGRNPLDSANVYIVTGDSGSGMTYGAIAGLLITDLIMGRQNPWAGLYDPARKVGVHSISDYAQETLNTVSQYTDWLRRSEAESTSQIPPGSGAIMSRGLHKVAVFKDLDGKCAQFSAVCPHLGGVVRWNGVEHTWDCPCHSSRFDAMGRVMHGPANQDLAVLPASEQVLK